jgi:GTPase involved in cell partitioning and DNA repair
MQFERCKPENAAGTGVQGVMRVSRAALEDVLGSPDGGDGYKTSAEWTLIFEDGTLATVYDYKGDEWHIGGHGPAAAERVIDVLTRAGYVGAEEA